MKVRLTDRDMSLLRWVNGFGFADIDHIARKLNVKRPTAYARAQKLVLANYLIHERIFHNRNGVYRVTKKGVQASSDYLSAIRKINIGKYEHDIRLVDISFVIAEKYPDVAEFVPERRVRHALGYLGVGSRGHICDGELLLGEKKAALELELSSKGRMRRESIIRYYTKNIDYEEVWYICGTNAIKKQMEPMVGNKKFIKLLELEDFYT